MRSHRGRMGTRKKEDGALILSYTVTQESEMLDIVKRWMPYMKVVEPQSLREMIHRDIELYLKY